MRLLEIPSEKYDEYMLNLMFDCYKWDPQFEDNNTIAKYILIITEEENQELEKLTEQLTKETIQAEHIINSNLKIAKSLELPRKISKELKSMKNYHQEQHIRLMRYDFHPTIEGKWAVSEVNSDVPGGFAEASLMPQAAMNCIENGHTYWFKNFGDIFVNTIVKKVKPNGRIMLIHCTSYSDDRQVMQFLGDKLKKTGFHIIYAAADHIRFENYEAISILGGNEGKIDAIIRFTPLEWLIEMEQKHWFGYFDTTTTSCNYPISIFAQTKRFPLIWDSLEQYGVDLSTWRKLLPETLEVKKLRTKDGYIFKPVYGRVGENISIKEACKDTEYKNIMKDVRRHPKKYIAQKKFNSKPVISENGESFHICLGSYSVDGRHAGYYARISKTPRIDSFAADIPVLIEGSKK